MLKGKTKDRYSVGLLPFRRRRGLACRRRLISELCTLRLEVADVPFLSRVERKVADRRHEPVDPQRDDAQKYIRERARLEAFGLERRVVDDYAADPSEKERQQKSYKLVIVHDFLLCRKTDTII